MKIKQLIANSQIKSAIDCMLNENSLPKDILNRGISLVAQYNDWEKQRALGTVKYDSFPAKIVFALLQLLDLAENQKSLFKTEDFHELHQFPRGPYVETSSVRLKLRDEIAKIIASEDAEQYIDEINAFRREANPNDDSVTFIRKDKLPNIGLSSSSVFWNRAINQACLHGPRMLAALLLTLPSQYFTKEASDLRKELLLKIKK